MEIFIGRELINLGYSVILGLIFGAFYDIIIIIQLSCGIVSIFGKEPGMSRKMSAFAVFAVLDFLFMLVCTAVFSIFLYASNNGGFRMYLLIGAAVGMAAYRYTIGKLVIFTAEKSLDAVRRAVKIVIVRPLGRLVFAAGRLVRFTVGCTLGHLVRMVRTGLGSMRTNRAMRRIEHDIRLDG